MNQKSTLSARLVVDDQVRRLYAEQMRATEVSQSWKAVAEAACYLSGVTTEEDICLASKVVKDACKGDSTNIFMYDEEKQSLWSDGEKSVRSGKREERGAQR